MEVDGNMDYSDDEYEPELVRNDKLTTLWINLKPELDKIYEESDEVNLPFLSKCYDSVFKYLMHVNQENIERRSNGHQEFHPGVSHEISRDLYFELISYIRDQSSRFIQIFNNISDDAKFPKYANCWIRFKTIHKKLQFIFRYLDRFFVPNERKNENVLIVYEVYRFALKIWLDILFSNYHDVLINEILNFMNLEREGNVIDRVLISCTSKSFIELGLVQGDDALQFYKPLESAFLDATKKYYREKSEKLMKELNVFKTITFEQYMILISESFVRETERVKTYFDESSTDAVIKICEECLIKDRIGIFNKACQDYLTLGNFAYMPKVYAFMSRFPEELEIFRKTFQTHVETEGDNTIAQLENVVKVDPTSYVEAVLSVYTKYESLIRDDFRGDEMFKQSLDLASKKFINDNAVTQASSFGDRNAELIAKYCDMIMSKSTSAVKHDELELKSKMEHILIIFKLLNDKDGFQKFYENITARRLIFNLSVSDEIEENMILELKGYFGEQDSHVLQKIIENIQASETINQEFKAVIEKERNTKVMKNFSVVILADKHWPYKSASPYASSRQYLEILPVALEPTIERFSRFYRTKFTGEKQPRKNENVGRKLQWLHNLGKGELNANFLGKQYILETGAFQMAVLMQFNENTSYEYEELEKNTGIMAAPAEFLQQTLLKLFEAEILTCSGDYTNLQPGTKIQLNIDFRRPKVRINLDQPLDAEAEISRKETLKHIDDDREVLTQCAIVRIMKRDKRLYHKELKLKVMDELNKRFRPETEMIIRSLQLSIGKDFIAHDKNDKDYYVYVD